MAYVVAAVRWEHGWELHIAGVGVTQTHGTFAAEEAERMARDYLRCDGRTDFDTAALTIRYGGQAPEHSDPA